MAASSNSRPPLFKLRIILAESAADAVQLELQASGGKAYLSEYGEGTTQIPILERMALVR